MDEEEYRRRMVDGKTDGALFALKAKRDEKDGMGSGWKVDGMGSGWKVDGMGDGKGSG